MAVFLAIFIQQNWSELPNAWRAVKTAQPAWLGLMLLAMVAWLLNLALMHAAAQRAAQLDTGRLDLIAPAVGGNALNLITKSGGMAGLVLFLTDARRRNKPRGSVVASYALAQSAGEVAFAATLIAALVLVWADGHLSRTEILASVVFGVYLTARLGAYVAAFRSRTAIRRLYSLPNRAVAAVRRREPAPIDVTGADEMYDSMMLLRQRPWGVAPVFGHAIGVEVIGIVELWAAAAAVGASHSLLVAFVGYSVSVLFAIVGFLPGGLGFVEVSLGAVLVSYGASVATATAAVVLYRVVEMWLPIVIGLAVAQRLRRSVRPAAESTDGAET